MSATNSVIQYPDFDPCIQQETNGARHCNALLKSMEKDMMDTFDKVAHMFKDNTNKWTHRLNDDLNLAEYPLTKQQFITLASIGKLIADCFNSARHKIEQELAAIAPPPKCTLKEDMQRAHEQIDISQKRLKHYKKKQNKIETELDKVTDKFSDVLLKTSKRNALESKKDKLEERLEKYQGRVESADGACQEAENVYKQDIKHLYIRSQKREFEQLQKLNKHIGGYIEAVQIPSCKNKIREINDQLISTRELNQDLEHWQRKWISTRISDKCITSYKQHSQSYIIEEPSSDDDDDDDDDDEEEDSCTAVVKYEANAKSRRSR